MFGDYVNIHTGTSMVSLYQRTVLTSPKEDHIMKYQGIVEKAYQEAANSESLAELLTARKVIAEIINFDEETLDIIPKVPAFTPAEAREYSGLTIREAAKKIGIKPARLEAIEAHTSYPTVETAVKISKAYGLDYEHIAWCKERRALHHKRAMSLLMFAAMFYAGRIWEREQAAAGKEVPA